MQTIWARVAQSRCTCNCSSCLFSAAAVARRSTTAAAGRRIQFSDVFTVFYSSVLATAAVADSNRKDARREAWDKAIAQAKVELEDLESQQQSRLAALSISPSEEQITKETMGEHWGDVFKWAYRQREERRSLGFQDWKGIPLDLLEGLSASEIQRALVDGRIARRLSGEPGSAAWDTESHAQILAPKKLKTLEWSVAKMALRLLSQIPNDGLVSKDGLEPIEDALLQHSLHTAQDLSSAISHIDERLLELQKHNQTLDERETLESPPYPRYKADSVIDVNDPNSLNATLRAILNAPAKKGVGKDTILAKVCYNLLMSTTPPNVHTYNMLLVKFCHLEERDLVFTVLTSMRESHVRPNEVTHSTTLKFFTLVENRPAFAKYIRLMEGLDQSLAVAHPGTKRIRITAGRYRFPEDYKSRTAQFARGKNGAPVSVECDLDTPRQTKIFEKARMNVEVYGALIHGALQLFGMEQAMQFYRAMICEGWHPNRMILISILRHCCYKEDWPSGVVVWQEMQKLARGANEKAYVWMLRLCRRCHQQTAFEEVLSEGTRRGLLPWTVWKLGDQIQTAEVNSLIDIAKQVQASPKSQFVERRIPRIRSEAKEHHEKKINQSAQILEHSTNKIQSMESTGHHSIVSTKQKPREPTVTAINKSARRHEPSPKAKKWCRYTRPGRIALDTGPIEVPALFDGGDSASPLKPTAYREKKQTQEPPSNLPLAYQGVLTMQIKPDQPFWEGLEEPLAATT